MCEVVRGVLPQEMSGTEGGSGGEREGWQEGGGDSQQREQSV